MRCSAGNAYLVIRKDGENIPRLEGVGVLQTRSELLCLELELAKGEVVVSGGIDKDLLAGLHAAGVGFEIVVDVDDGVYRIWV